MANFTSADSRRFCCWWPALISFCLTLRGCGSPAEPDGACIDPNTSHPPRRIQFAGFQWIVKNGFFDPGPNAWSDAPDNVWVDAQGLHLKITFRGGQWRSAEVILDRDMGGYGRYVFHTRGRLDQLDPNVVLGLFTYHYCDASFSHREIDIEFLKQCGQVGSNGCFTIQPFGNPGNMNCFTFASDSLDATHSFEWKSGRIDFQSGSHTWTYTGSDVPPPGGENVRMNLWLCGGIPPTDGQEVEVIITGFEFLP